MPLWLTVLCSALVLAPGPQPTHPLQALRDHRRVLLLFAPSASDPLLLAQVANLQGQEAALADYDLQVVRLVSGQSTSVYDTPAEQSWTRERLHIAPARFTLILLGKDGGEKLRSSKPVPLLRITALIDTMPMRRDEVARTVTKLTARLRYDARYADALPPGVFPLNVSLYDRALAAADFLRTRTPLRPRIGIILGSGLGAFGASVENATTIPYADIPGFPRSTVEGHSGNLLLGTVAGTPVAVMQGRVHAYEGYGMEAVTFPTRVLGLLGIETLVVTNAAGGIDPAYAPGSLVALCDHINLTGSNAALGPNEPRFAVVPGAGLRFFDMTVAYDAGLREIARTVAAEQGFDLPEGVYLAVLGPSYETPAEIRAFRTLGADLVGMSTVHEVIVARHMGMRVLGLSLVTNAAAGVSAQPIHHQEVMDIGQQAEARFAGWMRALVPRLS